MFKNYLKIAFRNLLKNKVFSFINIAGLSIGMAVAMLIGLWIWDELSFDKYHQNYDRLAQVWQFQTFNGRIGSQTAMPVPVGAELRNKYPDFKYVAMSSWNYDHIIAFEDKKFIKAGNYTEPDFPEMMTLKMLKGTRNGLKEVNSIMLAKSVADALFGDKDPINQIVKVDNKNSVKVTGVYEDLPYNTELRDVKLIMPWSLYLANENWVKRSETQWDNNSFQIYAQLHEGADFKQVSEKIKDIKKVNDKNTIPFNPTLFLHPMRDWHLYSEFKDGVQEGGRIQFVWLFGMIGAFVLLLACINFMNLSTARSEKRAKEVGIRKTVGSVRSQLIGQFLSESLLVVIFAFILSLLLVQISLFWFNEVADKKMSILWGSPIFWLMSLGFILITGFVAGSYPAFYLSSFNPVKVLKGTFKAGRFAALPRKVLVVLQFTVSVTLIIGTVIVFRQIQHAKNRPIGYSREGLIVMNMNTPDLYGHYEAIRNDLLTSGGAENMCESSSAVTGVWSTQIGYSWQGMPPDLNPLFGTIAVTHDYGKTVGWQFLEGRDFSKDYSTDTLSMVLNESAAKFIGFKNPIGEIIKKDDKEYKVIGVIKDMVMQSPYEPIQPTIFFLNYDWANMIFVKLNPQLSASEGLARVEKVFQKHNPASPFDYKFIDMEYAAKFSGEERIGKLSSFFAGLAIFISCLGLFGLASFVAEQRTKEIGVRKVLGANILQLWTLLSKDFVLLVIISFLIATPTAYYFMQNWLQQYNYRSEIAWWIFAFSGGGALLMTLLTVSYQAIKAARLNPVKSLRFE
ncbi:MAG: ABC transporter permease [Thermoflexibacter sp.]|jgi:ABC-type antimicrobial peptide transport system permease subunit|nr:ABC transporter permease [Thermoflexibacter sp.]